ncbi:MAG TPA: molybdopterin-synthase adenylyltransferase MoeB [Candidatus Eremiobacteraceae bacterium]|nr:molybdopterin-synthase adenylyltransferase MoeB [Candidatus Eremiobacteraceae bacterium]
MATQTSTFTPQELARYGRHLILPEIGQDGQRKLKEARVLLVGAGGLGSPAALYLAAAGVGTLGIVDYDRVELSNLHRQVLHGTSMTGRSKVDSAVRTIAEINPNVAVEGHDVQIDSGNAFELLRSYDIVVDGSDNFATRYLVNDACVLSGKPSVYGSVYRFEGQASLFDARLGPCYRCVFPEPPPPGAMPSCAQAGVLGVLPGIIGLIQATETIKLICGVGESLLGRLLLFDALEMRFRELKLRKDPNCPVCGEHPTITALVDYDKLCGDAPIARNGDVDDFELTVAQLKAKLDAGERIELLDVRRPDELAVAALPYTRWIEMRELGERMGELDKASQIVVYCHSGMRSARATHMLRQAGFENVKNLAGGIDAWSLEIDPTLPRY